VDFVQAKPGGCVSALTSSIHRNNFAKSLNNAKSAIFARRIFAINTEEMNKLN
jgi:hypothetical protein